MTASTLRLLESRRLKDVARAYRKAGYRVVVNPDESELPNFLRDFQPDLIAIADHESVVVEVKSQTGLVNAQELRSLASLVNSQPNWRFELVVTNPRTSSVDVVPTDVVWKRLNAIHQLTDQGQAEAAFLLLWSATEAVLRMIAAREDVHIERLSPDAIVKQLATLGLLAREDQRTLLAAANLRNSLVHGLATATVESNVVDRVSDVTERLLEDLDTGEASSDQPNQT